MPAALSASSRTRPAGPTNGLPSMSSRSPGCSPTNMISACSAPSPNTVWVLVLYRSQARQPAAASRSAGKVSCSGTSSNAWLAAAGGDNLLRGGLKGKAQGELAALTRFRDRRDVALVQARQLSGKVEAQPRSRHVAGRGQPAEAHEEPVHVVGSDPDTLVPDTHDREIPC